MQLCSLEKPSKVLFFMLRDAGVDVAGYAYIQSSCMAANDVSVAGLHDDPFEL